MPFLNNSCAAESAGAAEPPSQERFAEINALKYKRELSPREKMDYLAFKYRQSTGRALDFANPRSFTEKLNWLKVFYQNPKAAALADKALFPRVVKSALPDFAAHLTPQPAVTASAAEFANVHFPKLPWRFVAKSNFGSGAQRFVDKTYESMGLLKRLVASWLNPLSSQYYHALENCYLGIRPAVVCEPVINIDYSMDFFCFNGEPLYYWIILQPKGGERSGNVYRITGEMVQTRWHYQNFVTEPPKPPFMDELVHCARTLTKNFPHARADFNIGPDGWRFSEITFFSWAGLEPPSNPDFDLELGSHIKLGGAR